MPPSKMRIRGWALEAAVTCLLAASAAGAQQIDAVHGKPGHFVVGIDEKIGPSQLRPAEREAALAAAVPLREVLERNTALAHPRGYSVRIHRVYGKRTDWARFDSGLPFFAGAVGTFFEPDETPSPTHFSNLEFGIYVNTVMQCPLDEFTYPGDQQPWRLNGTLPVLEGGRRTGEFRGFSIYDGQCAILSHGAQPPFLPLTREQYTQLEINSFRVRLNEAHARLTVKELQPEIRDGVTSVAKQLSDIISQREQELQAMDAAAKAAPAVVNVGPDEAVLTTWDDPDAIPLSVPNPAFFDRTLPVSKIQSIEVHLPYMQGKSRAPGLPSGLSEDWIAAMGNIRDGMDWAALAALLGQN